MEDAAAAMDNMHEAELYGRILTVNIAKPNIMSKYKAGYLVLDLCAPLIGC